MSKLASFAAGFGGGYLKARDKEYERERQEKADARQAKLDDMQTELHQANMARLSAEQRDRSNKEAIDRAITEGMSAGTVQDAGAVRYTDADGAQKTAYQPDLKTAEFAAEQQRLEEGQSLTPPTTPSAPQAEQAASVRTLGGARRLFSGLTAAADAKKFVDENPITPYAKYMAMSEKLSTMAGGQEKADAYLKRAKEAEKEGAFRALTMLDAGDPEGALKAWNSTGAKRLGEGQKFVTVTDKAGNKIHRVVNSDGLVVVPNVEQAMLRYLSGIEGLTKQAETRANARARVQEELYKPRVLKPGEVFGALDPTDGKWKEFAAGNLPAGYEAMTDGQGNTVLRRIDGGGRGAGTGAGAGDKPKDALAEATKAVEFAIDKSAARGALEAPVVARANTLGRQLVAQAASENRSLDPSVAAEIAINTATGALKPANAFNPRTGTIDSVVEYQGNKFSIESFGSPTNSRLPPEQMAAVAIGFVNSVAPERRALLVAAARNSQARAKLDAQNDAEVRSPERLAELERDLGRKLTEADIAVVLGAAKATTQSQLELISRWMPSTKEGSKMVADMLEQAGYTRDGKSEAPKKEQPAATNPSLAQPGGMGLDPNSQAAQWRARQGQARADAARRDQERATAQQELSRQFQADRARLQPLELARKYHPLRGQLPTADAAELQRIERTIR
jgi:hypothetical protein